jgi:hypothetical protein
VGVMNKYDIICIQGEGLNQYFTLYIIGAYGVVLKCKNRNTDELVAIKKFKGDGGIF